MEDDGLEGKFLLVAWFFTGRVLNIEATLALSKYCGTLRRALKHGI